MAPASAFIIAFLCGLAVSSASGYYAQWRENAPGGFRPPFVTPERMARSVLLGVFAGPFFLICELRRGALGRTLPLYWLAAGATAAACWMLSSGIVILSISEQLRYAAGTVMG